MIEQSAELLFVKDTVIGVVARGGRNRTRSAKANPYAGQMQHFGVTGAVADGHKRSGEMADNLFFV